MKMSDRKQHENQATGIITTTWDSSGFLLDFSSMTIDRYIFRYKPLVSSNFLRARCKVYVGKEPMRK